MVDRSFTDIVNETRRHRLLSQDEKDQGLLLAASMGDSEGVRRALHEGARLTATGEYGERALHKAVHAKNAAVVRLLLESGADVQYPHWYGDTALHEAACTGVPAEIADMLIEAGANLDVRNRHGETPLDRARIHKNVEVAKLLENSAAQRVSKSSRGRTEPHRGR